MVLAQREIETVIVQKYRSYGPELRGGAPSVAHVLDGPPQHYLAFSVAAVLSLLLATMLTVVMMHNHVVLRGQPSRRR